MKMKRLLTVISVCVFIAAGMSCLAAGRQSGAAKTSTTSKTIATQPSTSAVSTLMETIGFVIDITPTEITLEGVGATGQEKLDIYVIDPKVKIENGISISEIAYGDRVLVKYASEGGKKIAKVINTQPVSAPVPSTQTGAMSTPSAQTTSIQAAAATTPSATSVTKPYSTQASTASTAQAVTPKTLSAQVSTTPTGAAQTPSSQTRSAQIGATAKTYGTQSSSSTQVAAAKTYTPTSSTPTTGAPAGTTKTYSMPTNSAQTGAAQTPSMQTGSTQMSTAKTYGSQSSTAKTSAAQPSAAVAAKLMQASGYVADISVNEIVLEWYDSSGKETQDSFDIDPNVKVQNAASIDEISYGDRVLVQYANEGGKKVAKVINLQATME